MSLISPHDDFYSYAPLPNWQGIVQYYGALAAKPEWKRIRPLFDFVKQLSTSCFSATYNPSIVDDVLFLTHDTESTARVSLAMIDERQFEIRRHDAGSDQPSTITVTSANALPILTHLLNNADQ